MKKLPQMWYAKLDRRSLFLPSRRIKYNKNLAGTLVEARMYNLGVKSVLSEAINSRKNL